MKKRVFNLLILVVALATTFSTFSQRKVETTHLIVKSAKNAAVLGTDETGRVVEKALDLSNVISENNIDSYIPQIKAGNNINIDFKNPLAPIISSTDTGLYFNGAGYRFIDETDIAFGSVGINAVDLSLVGIATSEIGVYGATGNYSFAAGSLVKASGYVSTAMGWMTEASGSYSYAFGRSSRSSGENSYSFGYKSISTAYGSLAFGVEARATSYVEAVFGTFNTTPYVYSQTSFDTRDRLFVVGNGTNSVNRSDALTILKSGKISAPSFDMAEITDAKDLVTLEKLQSELSSAGGISSIVAGTNVAIDNTDPANPIINVNGGINSTDLTYVPAANQGTVESSNGTDAIIPLASATNAGLMPANFRSLDDETATATLIAHEDNYTNGSFSINDPDIIVSYTRTGGVKRMKFSVPISFSGFTQTDEADWIIKIPLTKANATPSYGGNFHVLNSWFSAPETVSSSFIKEEYFSAKGYFKEIDNEIIIKVKLNTDASLSGISGSAVFYFQLVFASNN